jgi:translation initiation factor 2 subunit 2
LLKRIYDKIVEDKGALAMGGMKRHIEPPEVGRVGTKRIAWVNFMANCKSINRKPDHVLEFVLTELGTSGSTTGDNKLIIKGRFQSKQLENVLRKYIGMCCAVKNLHSRWVLADAKAPSSSAEYVTCRTCKSPNTDLKKENRILFKVCRDCGATSSVTAIKGGFRAQTKRKKK